MVDNGYLNWSCTVPPNINPTRYGDIRFSEWLESMRKDVECLFGIMKGRFCILRNGFRFYRIQNCDKLWLTCCALHNILLSINVSHKDREKGIPSDWETMYQRFQQNETNSRLRTPFTINRLNREFEMETLQPTTNDNINDATDLFNKCEKYSKHGKRIVSKMTLSLFRKCLVNHFQIRFEQKDIVWPTRISIAD